MHACNVFFNICLQIDIWEICVFSPVRIVSLVFFGSG
jgi:hypothetical protein